MTGRVTNAGYPRWTGPGGSYRTVQRFLQQRYRLGEVNWILVRHHLLDPTDTLLIAGDESVVTKIREADLRVWIVSFRRCYGHPVPGLSFFSLSLISVKERHLLSPDDGASAQSRLKRSQTKRHPEKKVSKDSRAEGRPKGSRTRIVARWNLSLI